MKPTIYQNCKLFYFDRNKLELGTINPSLVKVEFKKGVAFYYLINPNGLNLLIVQALNIKKASAKFLTLIMNYDNI